MPPLLSQKAVVITALVALSVIGTAVRGEPPPWWVTLLILAFAVFNVLVPRSIALSTRTIAVIASCAALVAPIEGAVVLAVVAAMFWAPAFLLEWTLGQRKPEGSPTPFAAGSRARRTTASIIVAVGVASICFRLIVGAGLQQSAALFVGIPVVLSLVVVFAVDPRSATGVACKSVTLGLLVSLIFLGEGVVCVLMSAPLFYVVAIAVGRAIDTARDTDRTPYSLRAAFPVMVMIVISLEGVHPSTSFDRDEAVTATKIIAVPADAVAHAVLAPPRFERTLPALLRAGFPQPIFAHRDTPAVGARWTVAFRGGEMRLDGIEPRTGDLTLELVEARAGLARWRALGDDSHMTHYLAWRGATVRWTAVPPNATRVEWTLHYRRSLDPAWYFGPIERFVVGVAADYLIDSVATP